MDADALKAGLRKALNRLPREVLETVPPILFKYAPVLEPIVPGLIDDLAPFVQAGMVEKMTGGLDVQELTSSIEEVFREFGLDVPAPKAA